MFDPQEILPALTARQTIRLKELLGAGNTLPWEETDYELQALKLVQPDRRNPDDATLNNWGWQVAMLLPDTPV